MVRETGDRGSRWARAGSRYSSFTRTPALQGVRPAQQRVIVDLVDTHERAGTQEPQNSRPDVDPLPSRVSHTPQHGSPESHRHASRRERTLISRHAGRLALFTVTAALCRLGNAKQSRSTAAKAHCRAIPTQGSPLAMR